MTPPLLCKCSHRASEHDARKPLEPCRHSPCGCGEWRLDARSRTGSEDESAAGDAA